VESNANTITAIFFVTSFFLLILTCFHCIHVLTPCQNFRSRTVCIAPGDSDPTRHRRTASRKP
jgi:hypothetical protein